jgi:hypothetical protein
MIIIQILAIRNGPSTNFIAFSISTKIKNKKITAPTELYGEFS